MINFLQGTIIEKSPTKLIIDVQGVGYEVNITLPCYENLGSIGEETTVSTYLHVREDNLQLYGFKSTAERELFLQLISAPGIGPKKAQVILSSVPIEKLQQYIIEDDLAALTSVPGIGKKTAQRLLVDLKDKIKPLTITRDKFISAGIDSPVRERIVNEALTALVSLGFTRNSVQMAVQKVMHQYQGDITLEGLIKQALRLL